MPPAKVYRIDQLKPKGYLSQIDDLSDEEQAILQEQKEASRQLFSLLLSAEEEADEVSSRRRLEEERLLRQRVRELSGAVEEIFSARGRKTYFDITGYTEQALLKEAQGGSVSEHARWRCYLCEPMRTLGWSRRRALGEATFSLYLQLHGSKLQGELLARLERRWDVGELGPLAASALAGPGFSLLVEVVREGVSSLIEGVLTPHLASWQRSTAAARTIGSGDRYLMAESIARLLLRNSAPK